MFPVPVSVCAKLNDIRLTELLVKGCVEAKKKLGVGSFVSLVKTDEVTEGSGNE